MCKGYSHYTISIFFALLVLPTFLHAADKSNLRGQRYCEIIFAQSESHYAVYNTIGLNDCPEQIWAKITPSKIMKETGTLRVHLNGPRYWVIDGIKNSSLVNPNVKIFYGLAMREAGVLHISFMDLFTSNKTYTARQVARKTTWVYQVGKPVYELIDPEGNVYVMQSYSIQKVPQNEASLSQLGSKLKLPQNWLFKTGVLKKTTTIQAIKNMAIVIQDNFLNTYQKATHDLLADNTNPNSI